MSNQETRQQLVQIADHGFAVPDGLDPIPLMLRAIPLLAEPKGEFRERVVYGTLARWSQGDGLPAEGLRRYHLALLDETALFHRIGERDSDSVFLRSFCVLLLAPTLAVHRQRPFLTAEDVRQTCRALTRYLHEERDLRGYVSEEKWWAHGIAHAADAVAQIVQCTEIDSKSIQLLLDAVGAAMTPTASVFVHEEDARMATAVIRLLKRDLVPREVVRDWLTRVVPAARYAGTLPGVHFRYVNARNFLRCLIFQGRKSELPGWQQAALEDAHEGLPNR